MAETAEKPKRKKSEKQGLHGWKAAVAVFGCGTLAALAVFGLIVSVLGFVFNAASSGVEGSEVPDVAVEQTGSPREELDPGGLDICSDYLPLISDINIDETISHEYSDDALDGDIGEDDRRVVSGDCGFTVTPDYGTTTRWFFDIDYEVLVRDPEQGRDQQAEQEFQQRISGVDEYFSSIQSQGDFGVADEAEFFYGTGVEGEDQYIVVARTRSAVYTITFLGDSESVEEAEVPENDFSRQADQLIYRLDDRFFKNIPE